MVRVVDRVIHSRDTYREDARVDLANPVSHGATCAVQQVYYPCMARNLPGERHDVDKCLRLNSVDA